MKTKIILACCTMAVAIVCNADADTINGNLTVQGGNIQTNNGFILAGGASGKLESNKQTIVGTYLTVAQYLTVGTTASIGSNLSVGSGMTVGSGMIVGNTTPSYLVVKNSFYVRDSANNDLFVVSSNGDITLSKVQGDIGMGQFGN